MKVAVYGSLKKGFGNSMLLKTSELLGEDVISGWTMYDLGHYPAVKTGDGTILVEVYEVNESTFQALDSLEGYPNFYNRKEVDTAYGKSWIYFIDDVNEMWSDIIVDSGVWEEGWRQN